MVSLAGRPVVLRVIAVEAVAVAVLIVSDGRVLLIVATFVVAGRAVAVETRMIVLGMVSIVRCLVSVLGACRGIALD